MKYRKKPVEVEARQLTEPEILNVFFWIGVPALLKHDMTGIIIQTPEGDMTANIGDWIIKGVAGEFYPCRADIFEATYEVVP